MRKTQNTDCQTCKVDDSDHHKTIQATQIGYVWASPIGQLEKFQVLTTIF